MKTKAVRIYGKHDLRLEEFELPPMREDQILARVVSDSLCMSSYKVAMQGARHRRVPDDVAVNPIILGHEFCGELVAVGEKWAGQFHPGQAFTVQPELNIPGRADTLGYSFPLVGGDATYILLHNEVMERGCLLPYQGDGFFCGSLAEPLSCVARAFHCSFHMVPGQYAHEMGIKEGGSMAILAGGGPMGLAAIDYVLHSDRRPSRLVVTDINEARLARAARILTAEDAAANGVELHYLNNGQVDDPAAAIKALNGGKGFDDVFVFAPLSEVVELADRVLGEDGCLNFFAGPADTSFSANFNFYNVHYNSTHVVGTSGGNTDDLKEALSLMSQGRLHPAILITHIGGLNAVIDTTLNLPNVPGGKKLIYTGIEMPLTAIDDFAELGRTDPLFARLHELCAANNGLWSAEAERTLLAAKLG